MKKIICIKNDINNKGFITIGKVYDLIRSGDSGSACVITADDGRVWKISKWCFEDLEIYRNKKINEILS